MTDHSTRIASPPATSRLAINLVLAAFILFLIVAYSRTRPTEDFVEYWASSRLLDSGHNPYSLNEVMEIEQSLGWSDRVPLMNLNPPWALPLVAPLGLFSSYPVAWLIWVLVLSCALSYSARILLDLYSDDRRVFPRESRWSEVLIAFTFFPALLCLRLGQISPLIVLGFSLFLWFESEQKYVLAGLSLSLAAIKPQLAYLVWIAIVLDTLRSARWKILAALASALISLSLICASLRSRVFNDYSALNRTGYFKIWHPAIGGMLRSVFHQGTHGFFLQFLPAVFGLLWFGFYWLTRGAHWRLRDGMPILLTVSVFTSPFAWTFDQILLVIPIVALSCSYFFRLGRMPRPIVWIYSAVNLLTLLAASPKGPAFLAAPLALLYAFWHSQGISTET